MWCNCSVCSVAWPCTHTCWHKQGDGIRLLVQFIWVFNKPSCLFAGKTNSICSHAQTTAASSNVTRCRRLCLVADAAGTDELVGGFEIHVNKTPPHNWNTHAGSGIRQENSAFIFILTYICAYAWNEPNMSCRLGQQEFSSFCSWSVGSSQWGTLPF